jgi:predicted negative regulator of RcsB-dependent stress response
MNTNLRNVVVVVLVVAVGVLGYLYYQERHREGRVEINVGSSGLTIKKD